MVTADIAGTIEKIRPQAVIVATGAYERTLAFPGNDLPGVYGAGAVQTLMNEYGIKPGDQVLMVGAGNIGLIVSYQLMQAGVKVKAVIDAADRIGGYLVHASKIRRAGVPILVRHTVEAALGDSEVEQAVIVEIDDEWQPIKETRQVLDLSLIHIYLIHEGTVMRHEKTAAAILFEPVFEITHAG